MAAPRTLFDKIWDNHVIAPQGEGSFLIYIDLHLIHEVTTPQAFEGLKLAGRKVRRPDATMAVADHNIPTTNRSAGAAGIQEPQSKLQVDTLERNVREFGIPYFSIDSIDQGIVHIIGPEQGLSQPGMTIVCGDSHTATHGALGALAFGIGIGVAAVVAMLAIGRGAQLQIQKQLASLGSNVLMIKQGAVRSEGYVKGVGWVTRLTMDLAALKDRIPFVTETDPSVSGQVQVGLSKSKLEHIGERSQSQLRQMHASEPDVGQFSPTVKTPNGHASPS